MLGAGMIGQSPPFVNLARPRQSFSHFVTFATWGSAGAAMGTAAILLPVGEFVPALTGIFLAVFLAQLLILLNWHNATHAWAFFLGTGAVGGTFFVREGLGVSTCSGITPGALLASPLACRVPLVDTIVELSFASLVISGLLGLAIWLARHQ